MYMDNKDDKRMNTQGQSQDSVKNTGGSPIHTLSEEEKKKKLIDEQKKQQDKNNTDKTM